MTRAPIALFCYKRVDTLKYCVEALKVCPESKDSDLIVFSDGPVSISDLPKVQSVREYLDTITHFKTIKVIYREENLGVDYNLIDGIKFMCNYFDCFIVVEDDLIVNKYYLTYLNYLLQFYKKNLNVFTISAFNWINKIPADYPYDVYFAKRFWPWGWASWSNRFESVDWIVSDKDEFINSKKIQRQFNKWGSDRSRMLISVLKGEMRTWDIRLDYDQFKKGLFTVFPVSTLVENIGYSSKDATHTFVYNRYKTDHYFKFNEPLILPDEVFLNSHIVKKFIRKNSLFSRLFTRLLRYLRYHNS